MDLNRISFQNPAQVGEVLLFKDQDPSMEDRWMKVTSVPDFEKDEDFQSYSDSEKEEIYSDQIIIMEGSHEVFACELYRKPE